MGEAGPIRPMCLNRLMFSTFFNLNWFLTHGLYHEGRRCLMRTYPPQSRWVKWINPEKGWQKNHPQKRPQKNNPNNHQKCHKTPRKNTKITKKTTKNTQKCHKTSQKPHQQPQKFVSLCRSPSRWVRRTLCRARRSSGPGVWAALGSRSSGWKS